MQQRIIERVENRPTDASAWRMLGKVQQQNGERSDAERSYRKAIQLEPTNAAAHHDLGQLLIENQQEQEGLDELQKVVQIAPESEYAMTAQTYLDLWNVETSPQEDPFISLVGFEAGEFDGSRRREEITNPLYEPIDDPAKVIDLVFDVGFQYNSNVALAPTSRQLSPGSRESFQLLLSPDFEWTISEAENSHWGVSYFGQWTFNEQSFRDFNLQSYQPGLFWETDLHQSSTIWIPRLSYDFIYDQFDGEEFGNRHAITASTLAIWDDINSSYFYYAADMSAFESQGEIPEFDSQDGWSHSIGASHEWYWKDQILRSLTLGGDLQSVNTDGTDYRYHGVQLYAGLKFVPVNTWELSLEGGGGYRDYFDFSEVPSRDETNLRGTIELEKQFSDQFSILSYFRYQTFQSDNVLFEADQYLAGILTRFEF